MARNLNQRERHAVRAKRLHADLVRESAKFWDDHAMGVPAARAHAIADRLLAEADAIEAGTVTLVEQEAA